MKAVLIILGAVPLAFAQPDFHACDAPHDLHIFYNANKGSPQRVELMRTRIKGDPDNIWYNRWYLQSTEIKPGSASAEYKARLDAHPDDPLFLYFYGLSLMGSNTHQAIESFERAVEKDTAFPWPHDSLMDIYASQVFKDPAKVAAHMYRFNALCPEDGAAFSHINVIQDKATLRDLVVRFRKAVEARGTIGVVNFYPRLWRAEFQAADPKDFDNLRLRVADDLKRVKELNPNNTAAIAEGYKLINDPLDAKKTELAAKPKPKAPAFFDAFEQWQTKNPWPNKDTSEVLTDKFNLALLAASEQWVKDFPKETNAFYWRLIALNWAKNPDKAAIEKAGDAVLESDALHKPAWTQNPYSLQVAQVWAPRDIRLADCLRLAAQGLAELNAAPVSPNDMRRVSVPSGPGWDWNISLARFSAWTVEGDASRKLKDFDKTRSVIAGMKAWIDAHHPETGNFEYAYRRQQGRLAQEEGRKLDALAYYQRAIFNAGFVSEERDLARALWLELGGGKDTFEQWLIDPNPKTVTPLPQNSAWTNHITPLALNGPDLNGKVWTIADLQGKKTFINVWATWCAPCREELPLVQKLFDEIKDRKDIQLITISIDSDLGLIGPFMSQNNYTFPVVLDSGLAEKVSPEMGVPRNWISDATGTLRLEKFGFSARDWLKETMTAVNTEFKSQ